MTTLTSQRSSGAHSLSSSSLASSRSGSSFFFNASDASSSQTEVSISPVGSPNPHTSHKTKDFLAAASAKLSKAREQVSHVLSDTTPKEPKWRSSVSASIVEEDVGYEPDGDIRGANIKPSGLQKARPKFLRVDTKQRKRAVNILFGAPAAATTHLNTPDVNNNHNSQPSPSPLPTSPDEALPTTRAAVPDYELERSNSNRTSLSLWRPPPGLGLALPSELPSKPIPSSSGHYLVYSPPLPPLIPQPPKVSLHPIDPPGTPSPMELLPPSIVTATAIASESSIGMQQGELLCEPIQIQILEQEHEHEHEHSNSSPLSSTYSSSSCYSCYSNSSPAEEGLSPPWTLPPLAGYAALPQTQTQTTPHQQSPPTLFNFGDGSLNLNSSHDGDGGGGGDWNPYFP